MRKANPIRHWAWFLAWLIPGVLLGFSVSSLWFIALPAAFAAGIALAVLRAYASASGLVSGAGIACLYFSCARAASGDCTGSSCPSLDSSFWLVAGIGLIAAGVILNLLIQIAIAAHQKSAAQDTPPGWNDDPDQPGRRRWWNGSEWMPGTDGSEASPRQ